MPAFRPMTNAELNARMYAAEVQHASAHFRAAPPAWWEAAQKTAEAELHRARLQEQQDLPGCPVGLAYN